MLETSFLFWAFATFIDRFMKNVIMTTKVILELLFVNDKVFIFGLSLLYSVHMFIYDNRHLIQKCQISRDVIHFPRNDLDYRLYHRRRHSPLFNGSNATQCAPFFQRNTRGEWTSETQKRCTFGSWCTKIAFDASS